MSRKIRLAAAAAVAAIAVSTAFGYALLSPARRWFTTPKNERVDNRGISSINTPDHGVAAAVAAVTKWNSAPGGPTLNILSSNSANVTYKQGDGISDLIFGDPHHICKGTCLAATLTGYYTTSGPKTCGSLTVDQITDADTSYNLAYNWRTVGEPGTCSNEIYLETVTTHEVGHIIGLAHSSNSSAIMYPSVSYCSNKPLASDDTNGRNALYNCTLH